MMTAGVTGFIPADGSLIAGIGLLAIESQTLTIDRTTVQTKGDSVFAPFL